MSYLQELQQQLRELIGEIDEAKQKAIVQLLGRKSTRVGRTGGRMAKRSQRLTAPAPISDRQANGLHRINSATAGGVPPAFLFARRRAYGRP